MATDHSTNYDPLRNPQVDYERADLSAKGILWFLIGLFITGVFIELVVWGMFHFMARSEALFPQPKLNPMMAAQKAPPDVGGPRSVLQNTPGVNLGVFPEPRLQTNDAGDMDHYLASEQKVLNAEQPFADANGAIHISIAQAMKLIEDRGLPVRTNSPPPDFGAITSGGSQVTNAAPGAVDPGGAGDHIAKPATGRGHGAGSMATEPKQP